MTENKGILYVVATPIGNLDDMTMRAIETLRSVDLIIAEDTRTSRKLLNRYEISNSMQSYYSPKEKVLAKRYIEKLESGTDIALISENGTPCVSDPGIVITKLAYDAGIRVIPIPGASALAAAISASGMPSNEVFFAGFIPRKKMQRKKYLEKHLLSGYTFIFYESKYRIKDTLKFIKEIAPEITVCLAREMTKKFEEFIKGSITEVQERIEGKGNIKGEFVIICAGSESI